MNAVMSDSHVRKAGKPVHIACASGFWGDSQIAIPQLLTAPKLDYIVFDYLAETTMSILQRARMRNPELGYATDFVSAVIRPHLRTLLERGVRLVSNAGGLNPLAAGMPFWRLRANRAWSRASPWLPAMMCPRCRRTSRMPMARTLPQGWMPSVRCFRPMPTWELPDCAGTGARCGHCHHGQGSGQRIGAWHRRARARLVLHRL